MFAITRLHLVLCTPIVHMHFHKMHNWVFYPIKKSNTVCGFFFVVLSFFLLFVTTTLTLN